MQHFQTKLIQLFCIKSANKRKKYIYIISVLTLLSLNRTRLSGLQAELVNTKDALKKSLRPQQPICAAALIVLMTDNGDASCRLALSKYKLKVERVGHTHYIFILILFQTSCSSFQQDTLQASSNYTTCALYSKSSQFGLNFKSVLNCSACPFMTHQ